MNLKKESTDSKSLMDRLLDNAKKTQSSAKEELLNNSLSQKQQIAQKSDDVLTNIYLSSQKNSIYGQMLANKSEGVKTVKDAQNIEDVKKRCKSFRLRIKRC